MIGEPLLRYRVHGGNTIDENHRKVRVEWAAIIAWHVCRLASTNGLKKETMDKTRKAIEIARRHSLLPLVQWFSWLSAAASKDGHPPYESGGWTEAVARALEIDA